MASTPAAVIERRLRTLMRRLPQALAGDVEGIHQARVASRRLRAAVPVMATGLVGVRARKLQRRLRGVTRALGTVRELDVARVTVAELSDRWPAARAARAPLEARLGQKRGRAFAEARGQLTDQRVRRLREHVEILVGRLTEGPEAPVWTDALAAHVSRQAEGVVAAVDEAGALYAVEPLHTVRIAAKRLRYALELADETGVARVSGPIRRLKEAQDALGRLHDLDVLVSYARELEIEQPAGPGLEAGLDHLVREITRESRLLHAQYVHQARRLVQVAGAVASRVGRLGAPVDGSVVAGSKRPRGQGIKG